MGRWLPGENNAVQTRVDAVHYAAKSRDAGVSYATLKGRKDRCPVARGDHDPKPDGENPDVVLTIDGEPASSWIDRQCDMKGLPFQLAHAYAAEYNDQDNVLPCSEDDAECSAMTQWEGIPRDDQGAPAVDVIHATHPFVYVPSLRAHTNIVIDETPSAFTVDLDQDRIRRAVNAYLNEIMLDWANAAFEDHRDQAIKLTEDDFSE